MKAPTVLVQAEYFHASTEEKQGIQNGAISKYNSTLLKCILGDEFAEFSLPRDFALPTPPLNRGDKINLELGLSKDKFNKSQFKAVGFSAVNPKKADKV